MQLEVKKISTNLKQNTEKKSIPRNQYYKEIAEILRTSRVKQITHFQMNGRAKGEFSTAAVSGCYSGRNVFIVIREDFKVHLIN